MANQCLPWYLLAGTFVETLICIFTSTCIVAGIIPGLSLVVHGSLVYTHGYKETLLMWKSSVPGILACS